MITPSWLYFFFPLADERENGYPGFSLLPIDSVM